MKKTILVLILSLFTANVYADSHVKRILSTSQTGMGNDIVYPTGKAKITAFEFTVPVGAPVTPHTHSFPVLIMIQQGEIELIHEGKKYLKSDGKLILEHGHNQKEECVNFFQKKGYNNIQCLLDLNNMIDAGANRIGTSSGVKILNE